MRRRQFLGAAALLAFRSSPSQAGTVPRIKNGAHSPLRIVNEYSLFLPGEREALQAAPKVDRVEHGSVQLRGTQRRLIPGQEAGGWVLVAVFSMNGTDTAVFEKRVSHQGAVVYVTVEGGVILRIPTLIGALANIKPRSITAGEIKFTREAPYRPGPDRLAQYILDSDEDPSYENVAAVGAEYIGWTLVGNEQAGPRRSLFLEADGTSRELVPSAAAQDALWVPDVEGRVFDPHDLLPDEYPELYAYVNGFSKRTLLGGYLPVANTGVWNPETKTGYEVTVLLPPGEEAKPIGRVMASVPEWAATDGRQNKGAHFERYWNGTSDEFWSQLAGVANRWQHLFEDHMQVEIPDPWLLDAARAGLTLSRCSYRGLRPTYQIGEGAYTKIPERSHALFPVAHYEFVWAHQLWNLTAEADPYFQFYLDNYILPDGNFLYNTQDQVEAPLNAGVFLWNSARAYDYTHDLAALQKRLPVLRRMIEYVLARYRYSREAFPASDRHYGLIWGSPEADLGDPENDYPNSHPYYFQNSVWTWRGLKEHARCLATAGREHTLPELEAEGKRYSAMAAEMRPLIEHSLAATIAAGNAQMRAAGITPFTPDDTSRQPSYLSSYENHRFMMDWFTADWGNQALDLGHLKHRELAGQQIMGLHTDGDWNRTSNFMAHGTLAVRIRQADYRPFLLTLYALCCYAADCGNRYSPEDAFLPGSYPGDGNKYGWSAVVNSVLQPALGLRWLLCYEESDNDVCQLQKAAPKHWFSAGRAIDVKKCPTRFGVLSWTTQALSDSQWNLDIAVENAFTGDLLVHIHPPDGRALTSTSAGTLQGNAVLIHGAALSASQPLSLTVRV